MEEKISVIIPAYNVGKYLSKCVESVVNQSFKNLEIIIVDDGSKDDTLAIAKRWQGSDSRIIVIHQENRGFAAARNTGLNNACGTSILFLDSDDWLEKQCCEIAIKELASENADIVFFDYYKEYSNKTLKCHAHTASKIIYEKNKENVVFLYDMKTITAWGKLYRKSCLGEQKYNESMRTAEDVDFNYRVYQSVSKAIFINECLLHYRILKKSAIHGFDPMIQEKFIYPLDTVKNYTVNVDDEMKAAYYSFAAIAYIAICQNGIALDSQINFEKKMKNIKDFNKIEWVRQLFENTKSVRIPVSRKLIILFGKYNINLGTLIAIAIKQRMEK
jgi:glycosyltransferase involved in cell wall biosynthesis